MSNEMESAGIRFEVQWKKKSGVVGRREDVTSIGLWDPEDSTLDWKTFKTYLCQNIGTKGDISVAYVDSEGDELPIESECEFQEALKFARERARKGRETLLKVDRQGSSSSPSQTALVPKPLAIRCDKVKHTKLGHKSLHKVSGVTDVRTNSEERKSKLKKHGSYGDAPLIHTEKMQLISKLMDDLKTKNDSQTDVEGEDVAPEWFKIYMQKLKTELISEVTARVLHGMQQMLEQPAGSRSAPERNTSTWPATKTKKKKKVSDEDSSDGALGSDSRDHKLLKKIEKLHKREKKLEKKLDSKLEKLENKTKRMMEKKSQSKARCERAPEKKVNVASRKKCGDVLTGTYLMDAILLNDRPKTEMHIQPGERFTKVWEIMNTGTLPWTDKTELRQAWGTMGLDPEETIVKCPILEPGEKGIIAVTFRAPEYPGTFESYWHFYHMGDRFGHWIGCAVVVDARDRLEKKDNPADNAEASVENKFRTEHPVDLTVKSKADQESNCAECVNTAERETKPHQSKNPEYESDSDSDNLSIISGTVSLSSDSEEEDNFVHVPMPACFLYDVPLGSVDTVPVVVKESSRKPNVKTETLIHLFEAEPKAEEHSQSKETEPDENKAVSEHPDVETDSEDAAAEPSQDRVFAVDTEGQCRVESLEPDNVEFRNFPMDKVYAVDMAGHCMPIEPQHFGGTPPHSDGNSNAKTDHDPLGNVIHILPETLVSGAVNAVNVATSAFITARSVISNLRSKPPGDYGDWTWNGSASGSPSTPTDRSTSESLKLLVEMGFTNKVLNVLLLQRYDNDVAKVVAELLSYEDHGANGYH